jgi:hypothetical protein
MTVTAEAYHAAFAAACDEYRRLPQTPHPAQDVEFGQFIAAIYDSSVPCNVIQALSISDSPRRELLLTLLVGRAYHHRPVASPADAEMALELGFKQPKP